MRSAQGLPRTHKLTMDDAEPQHSPVGPLPLGQCPCAVPAPECCWSWSQSVCSQGMDAVGGVGGGGTARPSPASPSFPRQASRQEAGRQEGRGAATLEATAQQGGGEPNALPWLCWLGNPHPVRIADSSKGAALHPVPAKGTSKLGTRAPPHSCQSSRQVKPHWPSLCPLHSTANLRTIIFRVR